jgi:outer membrane immunogenic protein
MKKFIGLLGTVRGRAGWAVNNWLFYGSGGLVYGNVQSTLI